MSVRVACWISVQAEYVRPRRSRGTQPFLGREAASSSNLPRPIALRARKVRSVVADTCINYSSITTLLLGPLDGPHCLHDGLPGVILRLGRLRGGRMILLLE